MRRVLMVSPHFPPDTSAGAHRVRLLAPYLSQHGWEPTVVTVDTAAYEGRLDPDLARLVPGTLRVVRANGWRAQWTRPFGFGDLGLRSFLGLHGACEELLRREHFDVLYITIYPTYPALLGPVLKRNHRLPFVLDYQDPWVGSWGLDVGPGGHPDMRSRLSRAIAERLEPIAVRAADALTAVSARTYEDVLARIPDAAPRTCAAIPLGADAHDLAALRQLPRRNGSFDRHDGHVHICYVGTLLPKGREIAAGVFRALQHLRDTQPDLYARLRVHFIGTSNTRDASAPPSALPLAVAAGVADVVDEVAPRLDYLDALNAQVDATVLLLLGSSEPHYTPSKVYPALLTGRPVVGVYHRDSPVVELLRRAPQARVIAIGDGGAHQHVDAIAEALAWAVTAPQGEGHVHEASLAEWSTSAVAARLARVFDAVIA